jgi:hypothetical protein
MQNTTPFSGDRNPDLTQTIRSVMLNEHDNSAVEQDWVGDLHPRVVKDLHRHMATPKSALRSRQIHNTLLKHKVVNREGDAVHTSNNDSGSKGDAMYAGRGGSQQQIHGQSAVERHWASTHKRKGIHEGMNENTVDEYTELLESVLLALCEELELDPNELVEAMRLTPKRAAVLDREEKKSVKTMIAGNKTALKDKDRKKFNHANARYDRIRAIRRGSTGAGSLPGANQKWAPGDERNARAETPKERHEIGAIEREHRTGRTKSTKAHPRQGE